MNVATLKKPAAATAEAAPEPASALRQELASLLEAARRLQGDAAAFDEPLEALRARVPALGGIVAKVAEVQQRSVAETARWAENGARSDAPDFSSELAAAERAAAAARVQLGALEKAAQGILQRRGVVTGELLEVQARIGPLAVQILLEEANGIDARRRQAFEEGARLEAEMLALAEVLDRDLPAKKHIIGMLQKQVEQITNQQARELVQRWQRLLAALPNDPAATF